MLGNNYLTIQLYPNGAPQAAYVLDSTHPGFMAKLWELVKERRCVVEVPVSDLHRIVFCRAQLQAGGGRYEQDSLVMFGFRGRHALGLHCTDFERFSAHVEGFVEINKAEVR